MLIIIILTDYYIVLLISNNIPSFLSLSFDSFMNLSIVIDFIASIIKNI